MLMEMLEPKPGIPVPKTSNQAHRTSLRRAKNQGVVLTQFGIWLYSSNRKAKRLAGTGKLLDSWSAQQTDGAIEPWDFGRLCIAGYEEIHVRVCLRRSEDQGVRHPQRCEVRANFGRLVRNSHVDRENLGDQLGEEPLHLGLVVMAEPGAGQHLGVSHYRNQQSPLGNECSDRRVGYIVEGILPIEKTNNSIGVEDYRHSSRSPSTRPRRSPPVSRHPE